MNTRLSSQEPLFSTDSGLIYLSPDDYLGISNATWEAGTRDGLSAATTVTSSEIPLIQSPIIAPHMKESMDYPLWLYTAVKSFGVPNFMGARIPLSHGLNIPAWKEYKDLISDLYLIDFLEFGFPVGYTAPWVPTPHGSNHTTASAFPKHVDNYINTELLHKALCGPFHEQPFKQWTMASPLMSRPKQGSDKRRIIVDLSCPQGTSVNDGIPADTYLGVPYKLKLPSVLDLRDAIVKHGEGCWLWKRDLQRGYRQLRICPLDYPLLGVVWKNQWFIDLAVPFGLRWGAKYMQNTTSAVTQILSVEGHTAFNYIDDLAGVHKDKYKAQTSFDRASSLLQELGLEEATDKASPPATKMVWLGVQFDTLTMQMSIPERKIEECLTLVRQWQHKLDCTKSQLKKLLGKLFHVAMCNSTLRLFVNRMLDILRLAPEHGKVSLTPDFFLDLCWISSFLPQFNGIDMIQPLPTVAHDIIIDSCLTGAGGHFGSQWYHVRYPTSILDQHRPISDLEMLNAVAAIKLWAPQLAGHVVHIRCDNAAAVSVLQSGRGRSPFLLACAREAWSITATHNITITVSHVAGHDNILADKLSRCHLSISGSEEIANMAQNAGANVTELDLKFLQLTSAL